MKIQRQGGFFKMCLCLWCHPLRLTVQVCDIKMDEKRLKALKTDCHVTENVPSTYSRSYISCTKISIYPSHKSIKYPSMQLWNSIFSDLTERNCSNPVILIDDSIRRV